MQNAVTYVKENIDVKFIMNTVLAALAVGAVTIAAKKAGFKPLTAVVNAAK